jgi:ATP-dependent RNA helicase RhlE
MSINIAVASGEAPANMNATPKRANNGGGANRGQGRGGEGRGGENRGGEGRRARRSSGTSSASRSEGEVRANEERRERASPSGAPGCRAQRGLPRPAPWRSGTGNGRSLTTIWPRLRTSAGRPARKPQRPQPHGNNANGGDANRHHPGARSAPRNGQGRPARKPGEDRGAQANAGGGERGERREGNGGNRRGGPSRGGNGGQRRERA